MPRWKALPDELDPEIVEFTSQLRRLVNRSGLSIAAVADRTGYSKTSWERYLNGRLLAPKGAVVALADVTGTPPVHLTTMWELAERAWGRSEMRHDMTMEAIRISQARAALAETGQTALVDFGGLDSPGGPGGSGGSGGSSGSAGAGGKGGPSGKGGTAGTAGTTGATGRVGAGEGGPSGSSGAGAGAGAGSSAGAGASSGGAQWPSMSLQSDFAASYAPTPQHPQHPHQGQRGQQGQHTPGRPPAASPDKMRGRRKAVTFVAGVVGALLVIVAAVLLTDIGGDSDGGAVAKSPSSAPSSKAPALPAGVKCAGDDCTGQDPENMGCGGQYATTVSSATIGTSLVEVRYSKTCGAAWARITQAALGDEVRITSNGGKAQSGSVDGSKKDAYTPMAAVPTAADAKACATLATGTTGCTTTP
ncbi:XRE family transcriptional regulator [Streptomyces sp. NPDC088116]|uniref:XRE family transcriptional regulator n=1 Tax=Streptomyces sp. NPDC088116 TaxID=3365825 RepID=UPI00382CB289